MKEWLCKNIFLLLLGKINFIDVKLFNFDKLIFIYIFLLLILGIGVIICF